LNKPEYLLSSFQNENDEIEKILLMTNDTTLNNIKPTRHVNNTTQDDIEMFFGPKTTIKEKIANQIEKLGVHKRKKKHTKMSWWMLAMTYPHPSQG